MRFWWKEERKTLTEGMVKEFRRGTDKSACGKFATCRTDVNQRLSGSHPGDRIPLLRQDSGSRVDGAIQSLGGAGTRVSFRQVANLGHGSD